MKKKNNVSNPAIAYNSQLPSLLKRQHQTIMASFKDTLEFADTRKYSKLNESLHQFSEFVFHHFRTEHELYMYLELVMSKSNEVYRDMRMEVKDIAVSVFSLLNLHINIPVTEETIEKFCEDFLLIGKELLGRMQYEEKYLFIEYSDTH